MADQIEEIKSKIDIVQFINGFVPLKKTGRNFKALCPFHSEKTPSFVVSSERQIWHCFGGCAEGGDVFKFLMKIENIDFGEALRELAKKAGVKLVSYQPSPEEKDRQALYEINHLAAEFFHYLLLSHPAGKKALNYILGRGIKKESLEFFNLGYSPSMWDGLQKFLVGKKGYRVEDLERTGLAIESSKFKVQSSKFYDRFRGRLMFPLKNHRGNICGFAGRVLDPEVKEAKYVNTPETLIYHKSDLLYGLFENSKEIKKADEVVLVEGELDVISSYQAGVKNVVAIKGSALTYNQVKLLSRFTKNLNFALDADAAGDQAAHRAIEVAESFGLAMKVIEVKGGKDPDEVAQKDPESWKKQVKNAVPIYDYFLDSAFSRFGSKSAESKRKIGQELVPILAKISDKIVQAHYLKLLAKRLNVDEEAVAAQIAGFQTTSQVFSPPKVVNESARAGRREIIEEHLLALGFQSGKWAWLAKRKIVVLVKTPRLARILENLAVYLKRYKTFASNRLAKILPAELQEGFNKLYLVDLEEIIKDDEKIRLEHERTLFQLETLDLKQQLSQEKSLEKFRDLTKKLKEINQKG